MPTIAPPTLSELLHQSRLLHANDAAARAITELGPLEVKGSVHSHELLSTYRCRHEVLRTKPGAYASQLAESTAELCARLQQFDGNCAFVTLDTDAPSHFVVVLASDGTRILGCLRATSKLDVDDETWRELWGND